MDILKVVLHTPTPRKAALAINQMTLEQDSAWWKLFCADVRLTLVAVVDREEFRVGLSICNMKSDNFNKKLGIANATMRALTTPIYKSEISEMPTKLEVLDKLKELHMEVGNNLKEYKRICNG